MCAPQVLDVSEAASAPDLRPSRLACMLQVARDFVRNFFDQVRKQESNVVPSTEQNRTECTLCLHSAS